MADKKDIEALFTRIREMDPRAVMVVYSTREGNITSLDMAGFEMKDVPMLAHYTRFRFDKMMNAYFTGKGQPVAPSPPMMHAPQSNSQMGAAPVPPRKERATPVAKSVSRAIKDSRTPPRKKR